MVKPNKQGRRASMAGGSPMLSLFSPTAAPVDKKKKKNVNRRASITLGSPLTGAATATATTTIATATTTTASTQSTAYTQTTEISALPPPPLPAPKAVEKAPSPPKARHTRRPSTPRNHVVLEEVEICGMELLRSESMGTGDSFSYESYARDSFALAGGKGPMQGAFRGMPSRRMSNSSSLGIDSAEGIVPHPPLHHPAQQKSYQLKNWPASRRRSSCGGASAAGGADYNYYYGGQTPLPAASTGRQRRASVGSGEDRVYGRAPTGVVPVRGVSRRGSTGTCDLPGFGAYKARRRLSSGPASGVLGYVETSSTVLLNDSLHGNSLHGNSLHGNSLHGHSLHGHSLHGHSLHGHSLHGHARRGSMGSCARRGSMESCGSYARRGSVGSYGSYGRRGSIGSYGSYGRRGSMGSYGKIGSVSSGKSFGSGDMEPHYSGRNDALRNSSHESYRSGLSPTGGRPRT